MVEKQTTCTFIQQDRRQQKILRLIPAALRKHKSQIIYFLCSRGRARGIKGQKIVPWYKSESHEIPTAYMHPHHTLREKLSHFSKWRRARQTSSHARFIDTEWTPRRGLISPVYNYIQTAWCASGMRVRTNVYLVKSWTTFNRAPYFYGLSDAHARTRQIAATRRLPAEKRSKLMHIFSLCSLSRDLFCNDADCGALTHYRNRISRITFLTCFR